MIPLHPRLASDRYHLWVVYCGLILSLSPPLVRIHASPDPLLYSSKEAKFYAGAVSSAQETQRTRQLEPGKPIERELAGSQSHSYLMTPAAGQYVKLVIEQRGIDVGVKLFGPDGKQATALDSEIRAQGRETLEWVAEAAGSYRVDVSAKYKNAAAGRYEVQVVELRVATDDDRALHEARKLNTEFFRLHRAGKYDEARPLGERVLEIRERALGSDHPDVARSVNNLAILYDLKGDFARSELFYQRALAIREKVWGPEHPDVAASLNNLAFLYSKRADYAKAEEFYGRALTSGEKALGPEHPNVAATLLNFAILCYERGNYAKAELLFQRARAIFEKAFEPEHHYVLAVLNNLAVIYKSRNDYAKAEPLYLRTLTINEKALGPEHPDIADSLNNLANLYYDRGDYDKAEPFYQRALTIREKALGPEHPDLARPLENLADLYKDRGQYAMAEPLYVRALAIREKALGLEHPFVALTLDNLARLYSERGEYARAEPLYQRALAIGERSVGPEHPGVAQVLNNLANLYRARGEYARAEPLFGRALAIREKALGQEHKEFAESLADLARLHAAKGDYPQAVAFLARANDVEERNFARTLAIGSERQKLLYLSRFSKGTDFTLSLQGQVAPDDSQALDLAITTLLRRKGRGLDAMTDAIATLRRHATAQDLALFDRLADARSRLAALTLKDTDAAKPDTYLTRVKPLEIEVDKLEEELSSRSARFRAEKQPVTIDAIQAALPAGSALVEFAYFTPLELQTGKKRQPRYFAYLLAAQGERRWVDLGEAAAIDRAIEAWRQALRGNRVDAKHLARQVDEKIMQPVRSLLQPLLQLGPGQIRHLLIAPDGSLNLIPFAALVNEQNQYLVERYNISYLTSGRDLLRLRDSPPSQDAPLVVADPLFGTVAAIPMRGVQRIGNPQSGQQSGRQSGQEGGKRSGPTQIFFRPLPGTKAEALAIKAVLPEASVLLRRQATEAALKQARAPRILHIATHGFFLGDVEEPSVRSGLALSGANRGRDGDQDGVLTALEVAGLNLWGTKLVVLSACDTGVGEIKNSEGVQGLRRALVLAGSESQVMSLWPVTDEGAKELMTEYYRALRRGEGRSEGLRQVQLRMLRGRKDWRHPFYWAAFIQSGEWADLDGQR
jgi:CHAT domain-containing protein/Tfp pilus assembly protein PilF